MLKAWIGTVPAIAERMLSSYALPPTILSSLLSFAPVFSRRVWAHVQVLIAGSLLTPARRTVAAALRVTGLAHLKQFHRHHRVLSQAKWSGLAISRILLNLLVAAFAPDGPLVLGVDETLERRRGAKIAAKGIYHDPVRSSHSHFVKASGLRWSCLMLLVPVPWAARTWALPVLTALAPSERYARTRQRRHKTLTEWAGQERITNWGRSGRESVAIDGLVLNREGGIPGAEGRRQVTVQGPRARLEEEVGTVRCPLHRLLLGEALAEDGIDQ